MKGACMKDKNNDGHDAKTQIFVKPESGSDNDNRFLAQQLIFQPNIGLASDVRHPVVKILNANLANETILSQKTRSAHWNSIYSSKTIENRSNHV